MAQATNHGYNYGHVDDNVYTDLLGLALLILTIRILWNVLLNILSLLFLEKELGGERRWYRKSNAVEVEMIAFQIREARRDDNYGLNVWDYPMELRVKARKRVDEEERQRKRRQRRKEEKGRWRREEQEEKEKQREEFKDKVRRRREEAKEKKKREREEKNGKSKQGKAEERERKKWGRKEGRGIERVGREQGAGAQERVGHFGEGEN